MRIENSEVFNFDGALRGMRYPYKSNHKSDSFYGICPYTELRYLIDEFVSRNYPEEKKEKMFQYYKHNCIIKVSNGYCEYALIGPKDLDLAEKLYKGGSVHRKFLRQIFFSVDITAPVYLWSEIDTYKVATVENSESTMHTLAKENISWERFEMDDATDEEYDSEPLINFLDWLEERRKEFNETKDKKTWKILKRWLPCAWAQKRAYTGNYETLSGWVHQRERHKLTEWKTVLDWIKSLPYANVLILGENVND